MGISVSLTPKWYTVVENWKVGGLQCHDHCTKFHDSRSWVKMSGSDTVCGLCTVRNLINNEHGKVHPWCGNNKGEFHLLVKIF